MSGHGNDTNSDVSEERASGLTRREYSAVSALVATGAATGLGSMNVAAEPVQADGVAWETVTIGGGAFRVEQDGTDVTGTISAPDTGGWDTWQTVTVSGVDLSGGESVLRVYVEDGGFDLNTLEFSLDSGGTPTGEGEIVREYWTGVDGTSVADIPTDTGPDGTETVTDVFEGPVGWGDSYGARFEGYITAPEDGDYQFWIASDDNSELHLSTDDTAANASVIASVDGWTSHREWTKYDSQQSATQTLTAGNWYYVKVLHKEGGGGDNVSIGWRKPSDGSGSEPAEVIPAEQLSP